MSDPLDRTTVAALITASLALRPPTPLPPPTTLTTLTSTLLTHLPPTRTPPATTLAHLLTLPPALSSATLSPHYYAFVSGGTLPIAAAADALVTACDANPMVHSAASLATTLEARVLRILAELLRLDPAAWQGRALTDGATGSNILALAAARDALLDARLARRASNGEAACEAQTVANLGIVEAVRRAGVRGVQILAASPHSSVYKAAGVLGLGRGLVRDVGRAAAPWRFDLQRLEAEAARDAEEGGWLSIVVVGAGEVDTGGYGGGEREMGEIRRIVDRWSGDERGGWIHVDGAFGIFARALPLTPEFATLRAACAGLRFADSIAADAHKCLNVPYSSAFLLTRTSAHLTAVCSNGPAAYLAPADAPKAPEASKASKAEEEEVEEDEEDTPSPLNTSLANSHRFHALPLYAVLHSLGRPGLAALFASQVRLARAIAALVAQLPAYELLPLPITRSSNPSSSPSDATSSDAPSNDDFSHIGIIVLFRAASPAANATLLARINARNRIYVSGTRWGGQPAVRLAVAGWDVDVERDVGVVGGVLREVAGGE